MPASFSKITSVKAVNRTIECEKSDLISPKNQLLETSCGISGKNSNGKDAEESLSITQKLKKHYSIFASKYLRNREQKVGKSSLTNMAKTAAMNQPRIFYVGQDYSLKPEKRLAERNQELLDVASMLVNLKKYIKQTRDLRYRYEI